MLDYTQFQAAFPTDGLPPYETADLREIETFRKAFNGVLFIDRVLKALGIGEGRVYPPKGANGLRTLHHQVCESKATSFHKLSVLFYLLLDIDDVRGGQSHLADALAEESGLPQTYQILMRGLWHLDRKQFKFAVEHLAHPSLPPSEFADDIIVVLVRHAVANDYSLPLAYYHTTRPLIKRPETLDLLFGALARTSVTEALYFLRSYPEYVRQQLFEMLVASVLDHAEGAGPRGKELVSLPLSCPEEKWLHDYLTAGEGKKSKNAKPIVQMRQIVTGRSRGSVAIPGHSYADAAKVRC
ncbi:nuclear pore complex assembly-domain-containing protein [Podospora didyma]|uniref:Nuclear pore complex assembly-domain-containing protein n=1 Tax=Podospora didyma TaxID=330526 RepID=A0AAE0TZD5_9PEZI|nr:nuclear pore complex assembly-domain-containing protein [Podospora didyma]